MNKSYIKLCAATLILLFLTAPSNTLYSKDEAASLTESSVQSMENISKLVLENTPEYLSKPIIQSISWLENIRTEAGLIASKSTAELKKEVANIDNNAEQDKIDRTLRSKLYQMLKHAQLFLYSLISLILNTKFLFYIVFPLGLILALRYIWSFVFP